MRVELYLTVLAGLAGGLCGTLWSGLVSMPLLARRPAWRPPAWQLDSAARRLLHAVIHGTGGALAGVLFWLGWGLVAVVSAPWPAIGAAFGGLLWAGGALPLFGTLALQDRDRRAALLVATVEALVACLAAGLLCAYVWHEST